MGNDPGDDPTDPLADQLSLPQQPPLPSSSSLKFHQPTGHKLSIDGIADEHRRMLEDIAANAPAVAQAMAEHVGRMFAPTPAPSAPPRRSSPEAQALTAGILQGLALKYQDEAMAQAGQELEQRLLGSIPTPPATATKRLLPKPVTAVAKAKARRARRARNRRQSS